MSEKKTTSFAGINEKIALGIKSDANDGAVQKIIDKRVEAEVIRRADLLEKSLDKYNTAKRELEKCRPDMVSYNVVPDKDNNEVGTPMKFEAYSEKRIKEKEALKKLIADLDIAIMKAFNEGDYSKLQQLSGGTQKPAKEVVE